MSLLWRHVVLLSTLVLAAFTDGENVATRRNRMFSGLHFECDCTTEPCTCCGGARRACEVVDMPEGLRGRISTPTQPVRQNMDVDYNEWALLCVHFIPVIAKVCILYDDIFMRMDTTKLYMDMKGCIRFQTVIMGKKREFAYECVDVEFDLLKGKKFGLSFV
ncbi:hypothetical protein ScPMuIL_017171 [Solemya velum]